MGQPLPDGSYEIGGTVRADQFEERTGVDLPEGDWHTVAGYVIDAFDEIPAEGALVLDRRR